MKKGYLWGIIATLVIALAFVLGLQSCGNKAVVENNNNKETIFIFYTCNNRTAD